MQFERLGKQISDRLSQYLLTDPILEMNLSKLRKEELVELARGLEIVIPRVVRKTFLVSEIQKKTNKSKIQNLWDGILERKRPESQVLRRKNNLKQRSGSLRTQKGEVRRDREIWKNI